ncbi:MAG: hypothetical protein JOZ74_13455 [Bradyrhizobium sp.]|nr:hypothetical protein [Bradyrhizobium sp.]
MSNVRAKVASAFLAGVAAAAVSMALPSRSVSAADNCLTEPKGDSAQGKHWYYHIERGTGRHCWYLRGSEEKSARADDDKPAASDGPVSRSTDAAASHSFTNAHAEIVSKSGVTDGGSAAAWPSVSPNPSANATANHAAVGNAATAEAAPDASVASRWPQAADAASAPLPSSQPETSLMVADAQDSAPADSSPPAAAAPSQRQIGSIQKLALVAASALTLAGLTGSAVYRLGRRRRNDWLRERTAWESAQSPHRPPWIDEPRLAPDPGIADLDEMNRAELEPDLPLAMSETEPGEHVEKIEEFLARLTQQLHEELESSRPRSA